MPQAAETPRAVRLILYVPFSAVMLMGKRITQAEEAACRKT